jgi:hypothetical protein
MIQPADVQQLISKWWFAYDNALFDEWPEMWAKDAHFSCRTDTGTTNYEEFVNADVDGRDAVLVWQTEHRLGSPHPLRHGGENVHLMNPAESTSDFRSYIRVSQIISGSPSHLSTAIVHGSVTMEDGVLKIADLNVVLDTEDSTVLAEKESASA